MNAASGYDIFIRQDCSASVNGYSFNTSIDVATTGAPSNDTICGATDLVVNDPIVSYVNTTNATTSATDPAITCTTPNNNVWYKFTTGAAGVYNIAVHASQIAPYNTINGNKSAWMWLYAAIGTVTAVNIGSSNRIDWNTLSEEITDKFKLERSIDGKNFEKLTTIDAEGKANHYSYVDNVPLQGYNYYRLYMTGINSNGVYSEIVKAFVKGKGFTVEAYPNPVLNDVTVRVNGVVQGDDARVEILDVTGKLVRMVKMLGTEEKISTSGLSNGIYLIKYTDSDHTQTIRVHKQ